MPLNCFVRVIVTLIVVAFDFFAWFCTNKIFSYVKVVNVAKQLRTVFAGSSTSPNMPNTISLARW